MKYKINSAANLAINTSSLKIEEKTQLNAHKIYHSIDKI